MGRSVSYLNNSEFVLYFPTPEGLEEDGSYNEDMAQMNWDDMFLNLTSEIKACLPSYYDANEWEDRETRIFLKNNLCNIGISEYCGLCSLSVAVKEDTWNQKFAEHHASQIREKLEKIVDDVCGKRLAKIGTFSNGESVYQLAK